MEIHWFPFVGSQEACIPLAIPLLLAPTSISHSWLRKEHTLVCHFQTTLTLKYLPPRQLHNYQRRHFPMRQWTGLHGLFLLRL